MAMMAMTTSSSIKVKALRLAFRSALIVQTAHSLRLFLGLGQRRQQHCREYGDDGDDHEQFNQSESPALRRPPFAGGLWPSRRMLHARPPTAFFKRPALWQLMASISSFRIASAMSDC